MRCKEGVTGGTPVPAPRRAHVPERGQRAGVSAAPHGASAAEDAQPVARVDVAEQRAIRGSPAQVACDSLSTLWKRVKTIPADSG